MDVELRAYLDQRFGAIDQRFGVIDQRFGAIDQHFGPIDERFGVIDQRFDALEQSMERRLTGHRRELGVLIEQVRHELQTVAEMVVANTEAIVALRLRLDAR